MSLKVLGIETSCDETAVAVVEDGRNLLSNVITSQANLHARHGGIVPELASRQHLRDILPAVESALEQSGLTLDQVDLVAATYGPGLAGSLITGLNTAKAMSLSLGVPFMGVNHLEGHVYASWLTGQLPDEDPGFPLACLVASGGHTDLILMEGHGNYKLVGRTRDDAAGEAFDKAARILGLGFPGGPEIQRVSNNAEGTETMPRAWMRDTLDFSFSGVKTALLHRAQAHGVYPVDKPAGGNGDSGQGSEGPPEPEGPELERLVRELAAAFQESVVDVLTVKLTRMAESYKCKAVILGGRRNRQRQAAGRGGKEVSPAGDYPAAGAVHRQRSDDRRLRLLPVPTRRAVRPGPGRGPVAAFGLRRPRPRLEGPALTRR